MVVMGIEPMSKTIHTLPIVSDIVHQTVQVLEKLVNT